MPPAVAAIVYLLLVTGVAALAFELVEMPANRWIRAKVSARLGVRQPVLEQAAAA